MKEAVVVLYEQNKPLEIKDVDFPELQQGQVLVEVKYTGLCQTQMGEILGKRGEDKFLPHLLGHEGSGIVEAVGEGVTKVKPGDHVVMTWIKGQGANVPGCCYAHGEEKINSGAIATFAKKTVISENRLVKIDQKMPLDVAALFGCVVPTGSGIVFNTLKLTPEQSIVIFGMGGVGIAALMAAKYVGCQTIVAVDVRDDKLDNATRFGATHTLNAKNDDVVAEIKKITDGKGVDFAIESAGVIAAIEQAIDCVKLGSGLVVVAGNPPFGQKFSVNPFDLICGKNIIGSWGGATDPDRDIPIYVNHFLNGKIPYDQLLSHRFKFDEINDAVTTFQEASDVIRIMIEC